MTIAQQIAAKFNNDSFYAETEQGEKLEDMCYRLAANVTRRHGDASYDFQDGSTITIVNGMWDVGYRHCWCWVGGGHDESCEGHTDN